MRPFQHFSAGTLEEAIAALQGKSRIVAGGTDCLSILKNRILPTYPEVLVNIKTIPGLDYIREDAEGLRIGALTRLLALEESPVVKEKYGLLADAAKSVASPQIRTMGTLGGNLCQDVRCWYYRRPPSTGRDYFCYRKGGLVCFAVGGDNRYHAILGGKRCFAVCPSDTAVALSALDASIVVRGKAGERVIPIHDFFVTMGNVLAGDEIVKEIRVPQPPRGAKQRFIKFRLRKAIDFAIVSVAAVVTIESGVCQDARIILGAVAPTPLRAVKAEETIRGRTIDTTTAEAAAEAAVAGAIPLTMNAYKVQITRALVKRATLY